jgi:hypothetical protein
MTSDRRESLLTSLMKMARIKPNVGYPHMAVAKLLSFL